MKDDKAKKQSDKIFNVAAVLSVFSLLGKTKITTLWFYASTNQQCLLDVRMEGCMGRWSDGQLEDIMPPVLATAGTET